MEQGNNKIKLLIADDHTLFRDTLVEYILRSELDADVKITEGFGEAMSVLEEDSQQDLLILDLRMPGMSMKSFKTAREAYPDILIALMSGVAEEEDVREAFELGAAGYFPKTMSGKAMLQAIKLVLTGERFLPLDHKANTIMPSYFADEKPETKKVTPLYGGMEDSQSGFNGKAIENYKLTPREKDVLAHLVLGKSNKEIANSLGLQVVTVKLHVRGICRKLDANNRTQAALKAREHGLIVEEGR